MAIKSSEAIQYILRTECKHEKIQKDKWDLCIHIVTETCLQEGLSNEDINSLVNLLVTKRIGGAMTIQLLKLLVPRQKISCSNMKKILAWFFTVELSLSTQQKVIQWLTGIVFYKLCDTATVDLYYLTFLFLLQENEALITSLCPLLCLLTKPEDVNRWLVKIVLKFQNKYGTKSHINAFLSLMKSYRPDVIPENIPVTTISYVSTVFNTNLQKVHERNIMNGSMKNDNNLQVSNMSVPLYKGKTKKLRKLVPDVEDIKFTSSISSYESKTLMSIHKLRTINDLARNQINISIPAQTMSLLANLVGEHVLVFSDKVTQSRFSYSLYYTLHRVFLLRLEPYDYHQKSFLLKKIRSLEDYMQQGIPVVTRFLVEYLMSWNGFHFVDEILGLIEWITIKTDDELTICIYEPITQIYRSSSVTVKCKILKMFANLIRNIVTSETRVKQGMTPPFLHHSKEYDTAKYITHLTTFVRGLIVEGLNFSRRSDFGLLLDEALNFYEMVEMSETFGDIASWSVMPPIVAYSSLLSNSPLAIIRLCDILFRYTTSCYNRINNLGVIEEFGRQVQQVECITLDVYRCLWGNAESDDFDITYLFNDKEFLELLHSFHLKYGDEISQGMRVVNQAIFWNVNNWARPIDEEYIEENFRPLIDFKTLMEEKMTVPRFDVHDSNRFLM